MRFYSLNIHFSAEVQAKVFGASPATDYILLSTNNRKSTTRDSLIFSRPNQNRRMENVGNG